MSVVMTDDRKMRELTDVLDELGIEISVSGCGCCDSPVFIFKKDGKVIVSESNFNFTNTSDEDELPNYYFNRSDKGSV